VPLINPDDDRVIDDCGADGEVGRRSNLEMGGGYGWGMKLSGFGASKTQWLTLRLIWDIQHLLDINVALIVSHLCIYFYTPVIIKINPVGYTPLPLILHTLTGLGVPAQWNV
jgi:hypothetical protein